LWGGVRAENKKVAAQENKEKAETKWGESHSAVPGTDLRRFKKNKSGQT